VITWNHETDQFKNTTFKVEASSVLGPFGGNMSLFAELRKLQYWRNLKLISLLDIRILQRTSTGVLVVLTAKETMNGDDSTEDCILATSLFSGVSYFKTLFSGDFNGDSGDDDDSNFLFESEEDSKVSCFCNSTVEGILIPTSSFFSYPEDSFLWICSVTEPGWKRGIEELATDLEIWGVFWMMTNERKRVEFHTQCFLSMNSPLRMVKKCGDSCNRHIFVAVFDSLLNIFWIKKT